MNMGSFERTTVYILLAGAALLAACSSDSNWSEALVGNVSVPNAGDYWTVQAGAAGKSADAVGIAVGPAGTFYVTGTTNGGLDGNTLAGTYDYFVTGYTASRDRVFTKQTGAAGKETYSTGIAVDAGGNVYVTGYTNGGLDGNTLTGTQDYFVTKYTASGDRVYTKQAGAPLLYKNVTSYTTGNGIAVDLAGDMYVTGVTNSGLDGNTAIGTNDYFVTKYTATGGRVYTKQIGVAGKRVNSHGVAVDGVGNVYVTGSTEGGLDGITAIGANDCFVTKYTATGIWVFTQQTGTAGKYTYGYGVAVDAGGNVFVTGTTNGGLDGNTLAGTSDYFVTKYTSTGGWVFTKQSGAAGKETGGAGIAVDADGNVYVTGRTDGNLDGNTLTGIYDYFLAKFTSDGSWVFTSQSGAISARTGGSGVAVDPTGTVYVTGRTDQGLDGNTLTGTSDYFIAKYDSMGTKQ